jgi:hypothetical protein
MADCFFTLKKAVNTIPPCFRVVYSRILLFQCTTVGLLFQHTAQFVVRTVVCLLQDWDTALFCDCCLEPAVPTLMVKTDCCPVISQKDNCQPCHHTEPCISKTVFQALKSKQQAHKDPEREGKEKDRLKAVSLGSGKYRTGVLKHSLTTV